MTNQSLLCSEIVRKMTVFEIVVSVKYLYAVDDDGKIMVL